MTGLSSSLIITPGASEQLAAEDESSITEDESSDTEDESATENDHAPPIKKQKIQVVEKATRTVGASEKVAGKGKKVVVTSDEEQTPKPKKVKAKIHDEINFAAKKMSDEVKGDKYGESDEMESIYMPPSQHQTTVGGGSKKLKREGAIADINALYKKASNPDQNVSTENNISDLMDINKR